MAGAKETPRQKMIGMMYLVYTALLAMNVSKDILNAFDIVNAGVQETNHSIAGRIDAQYGSFESQYNLDKEKVGPYWQQAQAVRGKTDSLINFIEAIKWTLVKNIEKPSSFSDAIEKGLLNSPDTLQPNGRRKIFDVNTSKIKARDNFNDPTAFMLGGVVDGTGKAYELSAKIRKYRQDIIGILGEDHASEVGLNIQDSYTEGASSGDKIDWEHHNFFHTVLIADVTLLNKLVSEIQTTEMNTVTQLLQNVHGSDFTFENIGAKVFAESSYIISGQTYKAEAMVTAWKNSQNKAWVVEGRNANPDFIKSNGKEYISSEDGRIPLQFTASGTGEHEYHGIIEMRNPATNRMERYPFSGKYTVAPPSVTISPIKMNVVYAGIANPIKVSAPGFADNKVNVSATGATLTPLGNGTYNLNVNGNPQTVEVRASSEGVGLGSFTLRVKPLPKPTARIENVGSDGKVSKSALIGAGRIIAEMKDFDFEGVSYTVTGYTLKYKTKAGTNKESKISGNKFTEEMKGIFNSAQPQDLFIFTAIHVKGNDNKEKVLDNQIAVEIK